MKIKQLFKFILVIVMSILVTPVLIVYMVTEVIVSDYQYIVDNYINVQDEEE